MDAELLSWQAREPGKVGSISQYALDANDPLWTFSQSQVPYVGIISTSPSLTPEPDALSSVASCVVDTAPAWKRYPGSGYRGTDYGYLDERVAKSAAIEFADRIVARHDAVKPDARTLLLVLDGSTSVMAVETQRELLRRGWGVNEYRDKAKCVRLLVPGIKRKIEPSTDDFIVLVDDHVNNGNTLKHALNKLDGMNSGVEAVDLLLSITGFEQPVSAIAQEKLQ
jgi:hypothetical protein